MNLILVNQVEQLANLNDICIIQSSSSDPPSLVSPTTDDIFGAPLLSPRLGLEYQVEIPSLLTESERLLAFEFPLKTGLTIPVMWAHMEVVKSEELKDIFKCTVVSGHSYNGSNSNHLFSSSSALETEIFGSTLECSKTHMSPSSQINAHIGYSPLPESQDSPWSDTEIQSFLLGLYFFGKNLVQVRKFIVCKNMKDILSFYYGKFYRSDAYRRWSDCRKTRSRKCIQGQRILTGWRQQELLSRILPSMSKEVQDSLLEASKIFNVGKSSLEEFVFTLKAAVGLGVLIEAVGIGKGKQDLTGVILDPSRTSQAIHPRIEIPTGKACSSLASGDIIKFLTGDYRLSKARSNDLFWEAVWPRLLARGWHSECPRNICSKNNLVFLIPGIRKFSRRKLVKGDQYFDSVTDVLNKVASDPRLLELQDGGAEENGITKDDNKKAVSDHQHPSFLCPHPRFSDCNAEFMKFTVVDTSLVDSAAGSFKLRELRSLPFEEIGHNDIEETNSDSSTDQSTDTSSNDKESSEEASITTSTLSSSQPENVVNSSNTGVGKILINKRSQQEQPAFLGPLLKRQRLSACKQAMRNGYHKLLFDEKSNLDRKPVQASVKTLSTTPLSSKVGCSFYEAKPPQLAPFDLNQPQFPLDFEAEAHLYQTVKPQNFDGSKGFVNQNSSADEEPPSNGRRQSNRSRPPTAKALEALASGFLNISQKGKGLKRTRVRGMGSNSQLSRRTAKASLPAAAFFTATAPSIGFIDPDVINTELTFHTSLFVEPQIENERKEAHELLGML